MVKWGDLLSLYGKRSVDAKKDIRARVIIIFSMVASIGGVMRRRRRVGWTTPTSHAAFGASGGLRFFFGADRDEPGRTQRTRQANATIQREYEY